MANPRFEYHGDLAVTPLPEVLQTVYHYRVPGVLSTIRGGIEKKIFISNGDVIFATSGDRADSLGDYLMRTSRISQAQFDESIEILLMSGGEKRHGEVLVDMGVLTNQELFEIVLAQVRSIVDSVFDWDEGEVTFEVGQYRSDELIQLHIPMRQVILEGVKSIHDAKRLVSLLGPSWTVFDPAFSLDDLPDIGLSPGEHHLLQQVNGVRTLKELIGIGPGDAPHNAKLMYAFFALKLISKRDLTQRSIKKIQLRTAGGEFASD